jgi:septal ring factor EnvC (AmiA/AmiB activator)
MKSAKVIQMSKVDELNKEIEKLESLIEEAKKESAKLKDEVDSLWSMMDEITKSDIENWAHLVKELEQDVIVRSLMITKKKVDC